MKTNNKFHIKLIAFVLCVIVWATPTVHAVSLLTFDNLANGGFGDLAMGRNDDGSSNQLNLPFGVNFFGTTYNNFFVNNNGNITFQGPTGQFTPTPFPASPNPMIAPFWADVDTSCFTCGEVYVGAPNASTLMVTWNNVGFFPSNSSLTNSFQLLLHDQGSGNFDIEFRYERLEWTTGGASGGVGGLGGTPAQAGFDAGDFINFFTLPGSRTAAVLDLQNTTNINGGEAGDWLFSIREGSVPGTTPDNPLLPVIADGAFEFDFNININERIFIDPVVAIGYDYIVDSGPNFASVLIPGALPNGDNIFDLIVDGNTFTLVAGQVFDLAGLNGGLGFDSFSIQGIDTDELLDPNNPFAFVTGLTFVNSGIVSMRQIPILFNTDTTSTVAEPGVLTLLSLGLIFMGYLQRRRYN